MVSMFIPGHVQVHDWSRSLVSLAWDGKPQVHLQSERKYSHGPVWWIHVVWQNFLVLASPSVVHIVVCRLRKCTPKTIWIYSRSAVLEVHLSSTVEYEDSFPVAAHYKCIMIVQLMRCLQSSSGKWLSHKYLATGCAYGPSHCRWYLATMATSLHPSAQVPTEIGQVVSEQMCSLQMNWFSCFTHRLTWH